MIGMWIEGRSTVHKFGYIQEKHKISHQEINFQFDQFLSHSYFPPQEKELATSFPTYFWRTSPLYVESLHNPTLYITWQPACSTTNYLRTDDFESTPYEKSGFRESEVTGQ